MAEHQYDKALDVLGKAENPNNALPGLWLWKGVALEGLGRATEARAAYDREITGTGDPTAYYAAGILDSKNGSAKDAAVLLQRAMPIDSARYNVSYYLARVYTKLTNFEEALKYAQMSLARDPESSSNVQTTMRCSRKEAAILKRLQQNSLKKDRETVEKVAPWP
jgi:tetratricopeptide (TPR) repeat protein